MTKAEKQAQIEAMRKIGMSEEEIADVLESDAKIDHGEKLFSLEADKEKASKKARSTGTAKGTRKTVDKKTDEAKTAILSELMGAIPEAKTITNPTREFSFERNGDKYTVTLVKNTKKKP